MELPGHIRIRKPIKEVQQLRIYMQLKQQLHCIQTRLLHRFGTQRLLQTPQVRLYIEACFKALGINLAVLIQNMGIDLGYHIRLCVARIALGCFGCIRGSASGYRSCWLENHIRKVCVPFQTVKNITDHSILAGIHRPANGLCIQAFQ